MIVRSPRPRDGFVIISNQVIRDRRLTFRARGVLALLLSMPDNWKTSADAICRHALEGRDAIRKALRELEDCGYIRRQTNRDQTGRFQTTLVVFDNPSPTPEKPASVNQASIEEPKKKDLAPFTHTLTYVGWDAPWTPEQQTN